MARARDESLRRWLERRADAWRGLEARLRQRSGRAETPREAMALVEGLRSVSRDLALAQNLSPGGRLARYLRQLYLRAHDGVHRPPRALGAQGYETLRDSVPATLYAIRRRLVAVVALFLGSAGVAALLVSRFPELASLFASERMIAQVQQGELWTEDLTNVVPSSLFALGIMTNNIVVSLTAFALGALYGLGTVYIIALNGLMLGGIFAFTAQHGLASKLAEFVVAHGIVELSVICLAGAAGVGLGEALIRPGRRPRSEAFQEAVRQGGQIVLVGVLFLVGAGVIEGYVSPDPAFGWAGRVLIGGGYFALFVLVISGALWRLPARFR